ncbi:MAG: hypothetical protein JNJ48_06565 [Phycisphaerae bacterium]|nr:hypothetical protein [Phycisphaerae bacterium]
MHLARTTFALAALAGALLWPAGAVADPRNYRLTINPPAGTGTFSLQVGAPFVIGGATGSDLIGSYDAVTNPTGTRTRPGIVFSNFTDNQRVPLTSGSSNFTASNTATPSRPAGALTVMINPTGGSCAIAGLSVNVLNGAPIAFSPSVTIGWNTFTERNPSGFVPGTTITQPLGNASINAVTATQVNAVNAGTLTPAGPNQYTFSVPMDVLVTADATLDGQPFPVDPQTATVVVTGTVTVTGASASGGASTSLNSTQVQPGPTPQPPFPFTEPVFGGNLLVRITLGDVTVTAATTINVQAAGPRFAVADIATAGTAAPVPDGFLTGDDFDLFIQAFFAEQRDAIGRLIADVASSGGLLGEPDGFITGDDFDGFILAFFTG